MCAFELTHLCVRPFTSQKKERDAATRLARNQADAKQAAEEMVVYASRPRERNAPIRYTPTVSFVRVCQRFCLC